MTVASVVDLKASVRLNMWKSSLPEELEITSGSRLTATPHKLMLHLAYWWLSILLHRPFFHLKSRKIHSMDREAEIDHVKVNNILSSCEKLIQFFSTLVMSTCCRTYHGLVIYLALPLPTPILSNHPHPNRLLCRYGVPSYSYAGQLRNSYYSGRTSTFLGPGNAGAAISSRNRVVLELCHEHFRHPEKPHE